MKELHSKKSLSRRLALAFGSTAVALLAGTTPHTSADAAAPCDGRYTITAETVTDNDTHLNWQRYADVTPTSWSLASDYCTFLFLEGFGWRMPTTFELQSLVDESTTAPSLDAAAFDASTENGAYWSSEFFAGNPSRAWTVDFGILNKKGGWVEPDDVGLEKRVRCVRVAPPP